MPKAARRRSWRTPQDTVRRALMSLCLVLAASASAAQQGEQSSQGDWMAWFEAPTSRYGHDVLGGLPEWGRLCLAGPKKQACVSLPQRAVFEDIAPRLFDVDHDAALEAIVVESDAERGAQLAIYDLEGGALRKTATPHIGTRYRWLAPVGIGDLDGDGHVEFAYIDRPHLAKTLRIWRWQDRALHLVDSLAGLTNHRIGEDFITGGLRVCGQGQDLILVDARWRSIVRTRLEPQGRLSPPERIADFEGRASVVRAMACQN